MPSEDSGRLVGELVGPLDGGEVRCERWTNRRAEAGHWLVPRAALVMSGWSVYQWEEEGAQRSTRGNLGVHSAGTWSVHSARELVGALGQVIKSLGKWSVLVGPLEPWRGDVGELVSPLRGSLWSREQVGPLVGGHLWELRW
jgi:hypothetical protein